MPSRGKIVCRLLAPVKLPLARGTPSTTCRSLLGRAWRAASSRAKVTRANAEQVRDQFDGTMPKSYYCEDNFKRLDRAWELAEEKGLSVPQTALSYVLSYPLDIYALVGSMSGDEIAANVAGSRQSAH